MRASEDQDEEYAKRFWKRQPKGMREQMIQNVTVTGANAGFIGAFVDPNGPNEKDKEYMSAQRLLAKELGYEVDGYVFHKVSYTVTAKIRKKLR